MCGDQFSQPGGPGADIRGHPLEVQQEVMDVLVEAESVASGFRVPEGLLEGAEETPGTRDSQCHGSQLAQDLVPGLGGDPTLGGLDAGQNVMESGNPVWGQFHGQLEGVQEPAQHNLPGGPSGIPLAAFLDGGRLLPVGAVSWVQGSEDLVQGGQESSLDFGSTTCVALDQAHKVIHIDVPVGQGLLPEPSPSLVGRCRPGWPCWGRSRGERLSLRGCLSNCVQSMGWLWLVGGDSSVGQVCHCLCGSTEVGRGLFPTHGE